MRVDKSLNLPTSSSGEFRETLERGELFRVCAHLLERRVLARGVGGFRVRWFLHFEAGPDVPRVVEVGVSRAVLRGHDRFRDLDQLGRRKSLAVVSFPIWSPLRVIVRNSRRGWVVVGPRKSLENRTR